MSTQSNTRCSRESDSHFDQCLLGITHYQQYPAMLPYIGPEYCRASARLLLIGESNYLPEESTVHSSADSWYAGDQSALTDKEIDWVNCRKILAGDWAPSGHQIYRELNRCMGLAVSGFNGRPLSQAAFMNAYQRPARCGASMKWSDSHEDVRVATQVIRQVIECVKPNIVLFTSKYAWDTIGSQIAKEAESPLIDFVYHPACAWWNRKDSTHGRKKFLRLLQSNFPLEHTDT